MSEDSSIQVNFGKAMPLFPLEQVTLLPQQVLPLHIFEPRYRQMIEQALDGAGQLALAIYDRAGWRHEGGQPDLRPAVCVAQIVQHEKDDEGRYNILVQGVCRARILHELAKEDGRLYRAAMLEPVGLELTPADTSELEHMEGEQPSPDAQGSPTLARARSRIRDLLSEGPLTQMNHAEPVLAYVKNDELPTTAVLELVSFTLITDAKLRYRLLAEPAVDTRAKLIVRELEHLADIIRKAADQRPQDWPKGCSWN